MKWAFSWVGTKLDRRGKRHIYGWITTADKRYFRVHGEVKSCYIHMTEYYPYYETGGTYVGRKMKDGYQSVDDSEFKRKFPTIVQDIEAQFMLEKLKR